MNSDDLIDNYGNAALSSEIENGDLDAINVLVESGGNIDIEEHGVSMFHDAVFSYAFDIADWLLDKGVCINSTNDDNETALNIAVKNNDVEALKYLVENGLDITVTNEQGDTIFQEALFNYKFAAANWLLDNGADINAATGEYSNAFSKAINEELFDIADWLIEKGIEVDFENDFTDVFLACIEHGNLDTAEWLLSKGVDINTSGIWNGEKHNAITIAVEHGCIDKLSFLIENGANVNSEFGEKALDNVLGDLQMGNFSAEVLEFLIVNGVNLNRVDDKGNTFLFNIIDYDTTEYVEGYMGFDIFLKYGANINHVNNYGDTLLEYAMRNNQVGMVYWLLSNGVSLETRPGKNSYLFTAIQHVNSFFSNYVGYVVKSATPYIAKRLIEMGLNINETNNLGETLLIKAINNRQCDTHDQSVGEVELNIDIAAGDFDIIKMLIEEGADVNQRTKDGNTALIQAVNNYDVEIVQLLVDNNADLSIKDSNDLTALDIAYEKEYSEISSILIRHNVIK